MRLPRAAAERVNVEQLLGLTACLALALLAQVRALPLWTLAVIAAAAAIRVALAHRGRGAPPRALRGFVVLLVIGLFFAQFRSFNGLTAGTALLSLMAGLKLLETQTRRDVYVVTMIIYFLSLAALLEGESFWLLSYLGAVAWLTTATLLRLTSVAPLARWPDSARHAGRIVAQALPLALVFWLFFPRFNGPLWQMPGDTQGATSGLGDSMSPGDITELALSDEVAFHVRFSGAVPPVNERYFRGPVLHDTDGRTWRRTDRLPAAGAGLVPAGERYVYRVSLEPHQHVWVFALDWPLPPADASAHESLTGDYMLVQRDPITQPIDVTITSYSRAYAAGPLNDAERRRDLRLPARRNPRTVEFAHQLRESAADDLAYAQAVLDLFHRQAFYYTLTPPLLAENPVDGFLFGTRRGFCGHYASAFATLMRAAGIPARVVTGYQGGTFNPYADEWILRQSDAHAWDEIWIDGRGWLRIDPTSAIAPDRVERGLNDLVASDGPVTSRWQQRRHWLADARLRLDALRLLWRERILHFDQSSQDQLLALLRIPEPDGNKLVAVLAVCLSAALAWLTWQVKRDTEPRITDPLLRAYARLCRALAAAGLPRRPYEAPENFALRVAAARPDLGAAVTALCRRYALLRYAANPSPAALAQFVSAVRAFRPLPRTRRRS